jgi:N,N-dimethylformamidase
MVAGQWYFAAATYDSATGNVTVHQEPQHDFPTIDDRGSVDAAGIAGLAWDNDAPLLFAATWGGEDAGRTVGRALYNGKIDRPRISKAALPLAELQTLRADRWPERTQSTLAGAWDFSHDISGISVHDASNRGLHGVVVNMPTRGVTGHNFTGEDGMCWKDRPDQWSAIHFHDDDIYDVGWLTDFSLTVPESLKSGIFAVSIVAEDEEQFVTFVVRPARG